MKRDTQVTVVTTYVGGNMVIVKELLIPGINSSQQEFMLEEAWSKNY